MPPGSRKRRDRRRREEEDQPVLPAVERGHHIHVHEIHGREMVRHLRRPHIVALGYRPDP